MITLNVDYVKCKEVVEKLNNHFENKVELATNVFVVSPQTIIINSEHTRIGDELKKYNLNVIPINLTETAKDGGAFRCTTCPIERE